MTRTSPWVTGSCALLLAATACSDARTPSVEADASTDVAPLEDTRIEPLDCDITAQGLPTDLFCTGLYAAPAFGSIAADVHSYTPGVTLWSDGAEKHRYLFLPPGAQIETADLDAWKFPPGTKAWKEFILGGVRIETRLLWKREDGAWQSGTYVWNTNGTRATLNTSKQPLLLANGYEVPTEKDCGKCHHGGSDKLLGVEAVALGLPTAQGFTLNALAEAGFLSHPPANRTITLPLNEAGQPVKALGYLHANCGMACHSTRGLGEETQLLLRLRASEYFRTAADVDAGAGSSVDAGVGSQHDPAAKDTDIYRATVNQPPTTASVAQAFPGALRITPGAHEQSLVWLLAHTRDKYQMPPLVSHKVDEASMQELAAWIDSMKK